MRRPHSTNRLIRTTAALSLLILALVACRSTNISNSPSWTKAKVLADKEDHPSKIVTDGEAVYYVTGGTVASQSEGTNNVKKISLKDGSTSILVKGGDIIPDTTLAIDDKYVYWSDGGDILRVPKSGGASEKIIPNAPKPNRMVIDDENIYWLVWTGEGSPPEPIMYAPKKGGEAKQLTLPQPPTTGLCLDGDFVYWMTAQALKKIPKHGGAIVEVFRRDSGTSNGLAQDRDYFYFSGHDGGKSGLHKLNKKTGETSELVTSINYTMDFVVDDANVYYFDDVRGQGSFGPVALMKVAKAGGNPIELDRGNGGWLRHLAADSKQVYFTDISKVYAVEK